MDQRELEARVKALTKTIGANEPASNALSLLKALKDEAAPTEEMLRVRIYIPRSAQPGFCSRQPCFPHHPSPHTPYTHTNVNPLGHQGGRLRR